VDVDTGVTDEIIRKAVYLVSIHYFMDEQYLRKLEDAGVLFQGFELVGDRWHDFVGPSYKVS
jgi:hypothetical protein